MTKATHKPPNEKAIRVLLEKHACPVGYHGFRTRLLGAIACADPKVPFRVMPVPLEPTTANLGNLGMARGQEAEGFVTGLSTARTKLASQSAHTRMPRISATSGP